MAKTEKRKKATKLPADCAGCQGRGRQEGERLWSSSIAGGQLLNYFVICSGTNSRQIRAIADGVIEGACSRGEAGARRRLRPFGMDPARCFDFIVHVFAPELARFYGLERLWSNAEQVHAAQTTRLRKRAAHSGIAACCSRCATGWTRSSQSCSRQSAAPVSRSAARLRLPGTAGGQSPASPRCAISAATASPSSAFHLDARLSPLHQAAPLVRRARAIGPYAGTLRSVLRIEVKRAALGGRAARIRVRAAAPSMLSDCAVAVSRPAASCPTPGTGLQLSRRPCASPRTPRSSTRCGAHRADAYRRHCRSVAPREYCRRRIRGNSPNRAARGPVSSLGRRCANDWRDARRVRCALLDAGVRDVCALTAARVETPGS